LRKYAADPAVIGRTIQIDREPYQIIGVMRKDFEPAFIRSEMWLPLGIYEDNLPLPNATYIQTIGRLRPGIRESEASSEVDHMMGQLAGEYPKSLSGWTAFAMNFRRAQFNEQRNAVQVLLIAGFVLAVIACANVANLTLTEVLRRRSEAALRTILGATRKDLIITTFMESVFVAIAGSALGFAVSRAALVLLLPLSQADSLVPESVRFDGRVPQDPGTMLGVDTHYWQRKQRCLSYCWCQVACCCPPTCDFHPSLPATTVTTS
jgi:ABC-type antimicrobial peptide transport system permease subunit